MTKQTKIKNQGLEKFKHEVAKELGINLEKGNITTKEAGTIGGEMVRRMIKEYMRQYK